MFPVLCDLDGVVWLAHHPIEGSVEAIAALRNAGHRVLFVTNNSAAPIGEHEAALERIGIPASGDVVSSASAAGLLVSPGECVLVAGAAGIVEAVERRGATAVLGARVRLDDPGLRPELLERARAGEFDAVLVGWHRTVDFDSITLAVTAVRHGARLVATNDDATYPTPAGPIPGGGAIVAAIATAAGVQPQIAGKPFEPMARLVREMVGAEWSADAVMVGDRPSTDGLFAQQLGCRYAQVWSGVTRPGAVVELVPDLEADDLRSVVAALLTPSTGPLL